MATRLDQGKMVEQLKGKATWIIVLGLVMAVIGIVGVLLPHLATLVVEGMVAYLLIAAGIVTLVKAFGAGADSTRWYEVVMGLLYLAVGILLLVRPVEGVLALTLILAAYFFVDGLMRLALAFGPLAEGGRFWSVISGLCSLVMGVIIVAGYPFASTWVLGLLVGINLFFSGIGLLSLGVRLRSL